MSFSIITRDKVRSFFLPCWRHSPCSARQLKNVLNVGGADIRVEIFGGSSPTAKVVDNHDGSYTVTYTLGWADTYHIEVYVNNKKLDDCPFTIKAT